MNCNELEWRRVAQLAEHPDYTGEVAGSTPAPPTKFWTLTSPAAGGGRYALSL